MLLRFELFYSCFIKEIMVFKWMVKGVVIFFFFNGMFNYFKSMFSL